MMAVKIKHEGLSDAFTRVLVESEMVLHWRGGALEGGKYFPDYFEIELHGEAAKIPATKNSRIPIRGNRSILNHSTLGHMQALDALYETREPVYRPYFGKRPVFLLVISCKRSASCDLDNVLVSVRDWLEPSSKGKGGAKKRGWGIGLVEDDRQITGVCVASSLLGLELDYTRIIIRPMESVRESLINFVAGAQL